MSDRVRLFGGAMVEEWRRILWRSPSILVILLGLPVFYPVVVSWLYQRDQVVERPAIIVDQDGSGLSRRLALDLDATPEIAVVGRADSLEDAWKDLVAWKAEVLVWVPPDFSRRLARGEQAQLGLWVNTANVLTYGAAYPAVSAVVGDLNDRLDRKWLETRGVPADAAALRVMPVRVDSRFVFHPTLAYGSFLVPGVLLLVIQQLMMIGLALSAGLHREQGGFTGAAARMPFTWVTGKLVAQSGFQAAGLAFILGVVVPGFGWPMRNTASVALLFGLFLLATAPIAVLVARYVRDRYASFQLLMFVTVPLLMMSGFAWPLEQMPAYVRALGSAVPAVPALQALRVLTSRTGDLSVVAPQLVHLAVLAASWAGVVLGVAAVEGRVRGRHIATQHEAC